jgi:hypothetical protein
MTTVRFISEKPSARDNELMRSCGEEAHGSDQQQAHQDDNHEQGSKKTSKNFNWFNTGEHKGMNGRKAHLEALDFVLVGAQKRVLQCCNSQCQSDYSSVNVMGELGSKVRHHRRAGERCHPTIAIS